MCGVAASFGSLLLRLPYQMILAACVIIPAAFPFALCIDVLLGDALRAQSLWPFGGAAIAAAAFGLAAIIPWRKLAPEQVPAAAVAAAAAAARPPRFSAWVYLSRFSNLVVSLSAFSFFLALVLLVARGLQELDRISSSGVDHWTEWVVLAFVLLFVLLNQLSSAVPQLVNNGALYFLGAFYFAHVAQWYVFSEDTDAVAPSVHELDEPLVLFGAAVHFYNIYRFVDPTGATLYTMHPENVPAGSSTPIKAVSGHGRAWMNSMLLINSFALVFLHIKDHLLHRWVLRQLRRAFYYRREVCGCGAAGRCVLDWGGVDVPHGLRFLAHDVRTFSLERMQRADRGWVRRVADRCNCFWDDRWFDLKMIGYCLRYALTCGHLCSEPPAWTERQLASLRWRRWLKVRLEDMQDWVPPTYSFEDNKGVKVKSAAPLGVRQALPVYSICTTVNAWVRDREDTATFDHAVLQQGRYWRMADARHGDLDLGAITPLPSEKAQPMLLATLEKVNALPENDR